MSMYQDDDYSDSSNGGNIYYGYSADDEEGLEDLDEFTLPEDDSDTSF